MPTSSREKSITEGREMFDEIDLAFYERRAREERERERATTDASSASAHRALAEEYECKIRALAEARRFPAATD
jgi:hypothetical protein